MSKVWGADGEAYMNQEERLARNEAWGARVDRFAVPLDMTGAELRMIREALGLTQKDFAIAVGSRAGQSRVSDWESDRRTVPGSVAVAARGLRGQADRG